MIPGAPGKTIIGLTGSFGSGKSTVAHFFEELGASVIDADKLAHEALMPGTQTFEAISRSFKEALSVDGRAVVHKKLAELVFHDGEKKKKLESIVHPYVFKRILEEITQCEESIVIVEVPLLYETGYDKFCHKVIVVEAPEDMIDKRLADKGFTHDEIQARRASQIPMEEKTKRADMIIHNLNTFQQTRNEVEKAWKQLHSLPKGDVKKQWLEKE